jgi:glucose/arabinose dehydrogenase
MMRTMRPTPVLLLALLASAACGCGSGSPKSTTSSPALVPIGAGVRGPAGLHATVYATGLPHVAALALDAQGRVWATTSAAAGHAHDGVFLVRRAGARPRRLVSSIRGPLGLTWDRGQLYVTSLGRVDAFAGLRSGRFTQQRPVLVEPAGSGWNDGIVALPDGRLLMGISAPCDHCVPHGMWSATLVSFRTDGSGARVYARGIRAPFGLALLPGSSRLLVSMNQRDDLGPRTPGDWLSFVRSGQDWRFPGCYGQGGSVCAGVPPPLAVLDRHAAAGGVAVVDGGRAALVAEWQKGKVLRVPLPASGATTGAVAQPYLTGIRTPLPLLVLRDGSLLVGDWSSGTLYRIARTR